MAKKEYTIEASGHYFVGVREYPTEVAKEQARQNVEFWKIVEEEGLNEDDFFKIDSSVAGQ